MANATRRYASQPNEDVSLTRLPPLVTASESDNSGGAWKSARSAQDEFFELFSANQTGMGAGRLA